MKSSILKIIMTNFIGRSKRDGEINFINYSMQVRRITLQILMFLLLEKNLNYTHRINFVKVKKAMKNIKIGRACNSDGILIEVWKYPG